LEQKLNFIIITISIAIEITLLIFVPPHVNAGDFLSYRSLYQIYGDSNVSEFISIDTRDIVGSRDYGFNVISYLFSTIISFDSFIRLLSLTYYALMAKLLYKNNLVNLMLIMPFTFYIVAIQFSAIRLEMAIVVFLFFYLNANNKLAMLSILFHAQIAPIFVMIFKGNNFFKILFLCFFIATILFFYSPYLKEKIIFYSSENLDSSKNLIREYGFIIYSALIVSLSRRKIDYVYIRKVILFIPLVFFIGAARINILLFIMMILNLDPNGAKSKLVQIPLLTFFLYDFYKGILFIQGIIQGNSGFDNVLTFF
jgi:hypothetical protein